MKIQEKLSKNIWLLVILILVLVLRLPSFWEPYWYGDEGIYLVIGQALRHGAVLYRDIWDNKPPLLYLIYAISPTLLWAKLSATIFVLGTTAGAYYLAKKIFAPGETGWTGLWAAFAALFSGVFLTLPLFEGTIANAELYFTLPIAVAALIIFEKEPKSVSRRKYFLVGLLMTGAFLLKVPALFDILGMLTAVFIVRLVNTPLKAMAILRNLWEFLVNSLLPAGVAFVLPLIIVCGYFYLNRAMGDFLVASFSQNAAYVAIDSGPLSRLSNPLFIKGIILLAGVLFLAAGYRKKFVSKELLFLTMWFGFSLYGALLSNRPYMHYLLQIVPPGVLLVGYITVNIRRYFWMAAALLGLFYLLYRQFTGAFALDPAKYYQNWLDFTAEKKSWGEYVNAFDGRTQNSYDIAAFLKARTRPSEPIFVWGDAAFIYVLSQRPPATKFIQAHHLTTIPKENYGWIIGRLTMYQPKFIIVEQPVRFPFPQLDLFLKTNYEQTANFQNLVVYRNIAPITPRPFSPNY